MDGIFFCSLNNMDLDGIVELFFPLDQWVQYIFYSFNFKHSTFKNKQIKHFDFFRKKKLGPVLATNG